MVKLVLTLSMVLLSSKSQLDEIYVGKSFPWKVYYDPSKLQPVVEISGIKYGYLDRLQRERETLAKSESGELYIKAGNLFYKNTQLKIDIKLKKKPYSSGIDYQRLKLFKINAFYEISRLKDSLKVEYRLDEKFNSAVKSDYIFYRDNDSIPNGHTPNYKKEFYSSLKRD